MATYRGKMQRKKSVQGLAKVRGKFGELTGQGWRANEVRLYLYAIMPTACPLFTSHDYRT